MGHKVSGDIMNAGTNPYPTVTHSKIFVYISFDKANVKMTLFT